MDGQLARSGSGWSARAERRRVRVDRDARSPSSSVGSRSRDHAVWCRSPALAGPVSTGGAHLLANRPGVAGMPADLRRHEGVRAAWAPPRRSVPPPGARPVCLAQVTEPLGLGRVEDRRVNCAPALASVMARDRSGSRSGGRTRSGKRFRRCFPLAPAASWAYREWVEDSGVEHPIVEGSPAVAVVAKPALLRAGLQSDPAPVHSRLSSSLSAPARRIADATA